MTVISSFSRFVLGAAYRKWIVVPDAVG